MKILIVDDNDARLPKIIKSLVEDAAVSRECIFTETTGQGARDQMRERVFDLVILDVMLKHRPESEPSCETSVTLLTEVTETQNLKRPGQIIGLTAYQDAQETALSEFAQHAWTIVKSSDTSDQWLRILVNSVHYLGAQEQQYEKIEPEIDLVIVTALPMEMTALQRGWEWDIDEPFDDSQFFRRGRFKSRGRLFSVAAAVSPKMGMVSAATLVTKLISRLHPRVVVMPGICAGFSGKVEVGDVVLADQSWNYQSGKHVTTSENLTAFDVDPHFIPANPSICSKWDHLASDQGFALKIASEWQGERRRAPTLHRGPVASGSAVLADRNIAEGIQKQHRKAVGVEMEIYGVYYSVENAARPRPMVCSFKGVCDFADEHKNDNAQPFAAYASAAVTREFFERYMVDLL